MQTCIGWLVRRWRPKGPKEGPVEPTSPRDDTGVLRERLCHKVSSGVAPRLGVLGEILGYRVMYLPLDETPHASLVLEFDDGA